jgi:hypothetical protein
MACLPVGLRPPLTNTWAASIGLLGCAPSVDGDDHGLGAKFGADFADDFGVGEGCGVDANLVGTGVEDGGCLVGGADAAADGEGYEELLSCALHRGNQRASGFVGGCDVEEDDLVGPGSGVAGGDFRGIARVDKVDELHTFDDAACFDVEAGDDAFRQHGSHSRKLRRRRRPVSPDFSGWNWTPMILPCSTAALKGSP